MSLEGKTALVTGASMPRGIGRAIALRLARDGADVVVTGFSHMDGVESVAQEIKDLGRKSMAVKMNGRDYSDVQRAFAEIKNGLGPVNILVNNAAQMRRMVSIAKTTVEDWDAAVKLCLNSAFYCIKEAWPDMRANNWGRIVNMTSIAGILGGSGQTDYSAAKAGLIGLAKSTALEGGRFNITANCVLVGIASTEAYDEPIPEDLRQKIEKQTVIGRPANPEEIANAVAFAVSDEAQYMTGAVVNMVGGLDLWTM
ncbi:MAG: SDR family NAD(P)-dependent oxidoreductase [Dehalococcoidia bacterium]